MVLPRLIALLAIVILGSIAAQALWRALAPLLPLLIVLLVLGLLVGTGVSFFRNRW